LKLSRTTLAAATAPSLPLSAIGLPMIVYLPPYYAGTLGLDLATVGLVFFLVRLIDLPVDPVIGHIMDGRNTRFGRYRPWAVGGGLLIAAAAWGVYMAEPGLGATEAFVKLLLLYLGYSALFVSQMGWLATLSDDYAERARVFGWNQAAAVFAMVLVLALPALVAQADPTLGAAGGIHAMGWFLIVSAPLAVALLALRVPERPPLAGPAQVRLADFLALARNPLVRRLLLLDVFVGLAPGLTGAMFLFYFEHRLGFAPAQASLLLLFYFIAGFAFAPLWVRLAARIGKHRAMVAALVLYCLTQGGLALLPPGGFWETVAAMMVAGAPYTALYFFPRALMADVGDVDRLETGLDRNGLLQAVLTTTSKIAHAAPVAIVYPILSWIGFDPAPSATNTPDAVAGMTLLFVATPVALVMAGIWVAARWPHDAAAHARVQAALAARDAESRAAA